MHARLSFLALLMTVACQDQDDRNWVYGPGADTTDTGTPVEDNSDCPPTFSSASATIEQMPPIWALQAQGVFTEGSCAIDEGFAFIEVFQEGVSGGTWDESIVLAEETKGAATAFVEDYDAEAGSGTLIFTFEIGDQTANYDVEFYVYFDNGTQSDKVTASTY